MCWFTVQKFISIAFKLRLQEPLTDCFFFHYLTLIDKTKVMNGGVSRVNRIGFLKLETINGNSKNIVALPLQTTAAIIRVSMRLRMVSVS